VKNYPQFCRESCWLRGLPDGANVLYYIGTYYARGKLAICCLPLFLLGKRGPAVTSLAVVATSCPVSCSKGAAKALLYAAFGASAWNAQSALLQSRLSFAGAPAIESPAPPPHCSWVLSAPLLGLSRQQLQRFNIVGMSLFAGLSAVAFFRFHVCLSA
jgi:hypothetical protein